MAMYATYLDPSYLIAVIDANNRRPMMLLKAI